MDATVGAIFENSPAAKAGLKIGDVLAKVDGKEVLHPGQIGEMVRENPAREYSVVVRRPIETPESEEQQFETLTVPVLAEVPTNSKDGKAPSRASISGLVSATLRTPSKPAKSMASPAMDSHRQLDSQG